MVTQLYDKATLDKDTREKFRDSGALDMKGTNLFRLNLFNCLPSLFCCKSSTKRERLLVKGLQVYRQDTDLVNFIRTFLEFKDITDAVTKVAEN